MFGAFRPSAPLYGGLLWKIPWRMSAPQKLRHRRRLRRVDNIVSVLDNALKRQAASSSLSSSSSHSSQPSSQSLTTGKASPEELAAAAEGSRMLRTPQSASVEARRHGKGPKLGDMLPMFTPEGVRLPSSILLSDQAAATGSLKVIERWKAEMPTEQEMLPRDKYTMFDRNAKKYRKGLHKLPKWTRVSQRLNPPGY